MAIEISDLDTADRNLSTKTSSFLTELPLAEIESIRGGRRNCVFGRIEIATAISIPSPQVSFNIDSGDSTSGSGTIRIVGTAGDPNRISDSIEGKNLDRAGNFFYTNNGNAPLGGTPIPGFPGAYTF